MRTTKRADIATIIRSNRNPKDSTIVLSPQHCTNIKFTIPVPNPNFLASREFVHVCYPVFNKNSVPEDFNGVNTCNGQNTCYNLLMNTWNVYQKQKGQWKRIDTVFYTVDCDSEWVRKSLINHDGYPVDIVVKLG